MRRFWMLLPLAVLAAGLYAANAQPPQPPPGGGGQPGGGGRGGEGGGRGGDGGGRGGGGGRAGGMAGMRADPQVEAWVKMLAEKITDPHDEIRDSARAALVTVGPAALPTLRAMIDGNDGAKATAARKVLEAIEQSSQRQGMIQMMRGMAGGIARPDNIAPRPERRPDANPPSDRRPDANPPRGDRRPDANPPRGDRPPGGNPIETILDDLELNDRERKRAQDIQQRFRDKMRELREKMSGEGGNSEEARKRREEFQSAMMKQMKEVLGEERFKKFQERLREAASPRPDRD